MTTSNQKLNEPGLNTRLIELIVMMTDKEKLSLVKELEARLKLKKRKYERKPYFSTVCYTKRDGAHVDVIQNISAGGVFIGTSLPGSTGEELTLAFPLPISQEHIMLEGEIAWASKDGMGVKFKTVSNEETNRIQSLVNMI